MIFATVIGTICHIVFTRVLIYCVGVNDEVMALHYKINTQVKQNRASVNFTKLKSQSSLILCRGCWPELNFNWEADIEKKGLETSLLIISAES